MFGEAIQGIRVIKSYGWEDSFMERIAAIRKSESVELLINQRAMAVLLPIAVAIPALASGVTFVLRVVINGDACAHCCLCVSLTHVYLVPPQAIFPLVAPVSLPLGISRACPLPSSSFLSASAT